MDCPFCSDSRCCMARPVCLRLKRDVVDAAVRGAGILLDQAVEKLKGAGEHAGDHIYMDALVASVSVKAGLLWKAMRAQASLAVKS